jgi:PAS domain S-box-containing protein
MIPDTELILNVDDNDAARYAKSRILKSAGFRTVDAENGTDALTMVAQLRPDLVLLDVKLPDINGIEVCRRIKADPATSNILVLQTSAALTGRADKIRGLDGGADNYLAAPIEPDELIANVTALLRLRNAQTEWRNSEERFRQLTENIDDVFWMFDATDNTLLYVSPAYEKMWKQSTAVLTEIQANWLKSVHPDDREEIGLLYTCSEFTAYDKEYRLCQPDGTIIWVRDRTFLIKNAAQLVYRIARITSDISQRREMEMALRLADVHKNEFLATLAHELRNPLSPISNAVEIINVIENVPPEVKSAGEIIMRQVKQLSHLVEDLLDVARISQGKIDLRMSEIRLNAFLEVALETAAPFIKAKQQTVTVELPTAEIWLLGDSIRLAQSVGNLLHNATKFSPIKGQLQLHVSLPDLQTVRITIEDNGIGIAAEDQAHIFGLFSQGAIAPNRVQEGLGIGLSLVRRLIEMHHGEVSVYSRGVGEGSAFTIELPILRVVEKDPNIPLSSLPRIVKSNTSLKVLLVDDNVDLVTSLSTLLRIMGHQIFSVTDGISALDSALAQIPDVIIMDIGLPGMDGYQVARMIRSQPELKRVRLIAITGYGSDLDRATAIKAGFHLHLVKPVELPVLVAALADVVPLENK